MAGPLPYWVTKVCNILAPFAIEFIGTFFLVCAIGFNSLHGSPLAPFGIGFTLIVAVFAGGHISGAHYNPAVTLAVWVSRRKKISGLDALIYVVVQVLAAFLAGLFYWLIVDKTFVFTSGMGVSEGKVFAVEVVWTFLLATVVLQTATTETQAGNSFFGLAIGSTVAAGAITVGPISGGVFNPAVGLGVLAVDAIHHHDAESLKKVWIYLLAPLLGGLIAGLVFWFTNRLEFHDEPRLEGADGEHLFSMDVKSIADASAHKRKGGKIIKGIIRKELSGYQHLSIGPDVPETSADSINSSTWMGDSRTHE